MERGRLISRNREVVSLKPFGYELSRVLGANRTSDQLGVAYRGGHFAWMERLP